MDLAKYGFGLRTGINGFIRKGGGFANRAGFQHVYGGTAINSLGPYDDNGAVISSTTRLVPWDALDGTTAYVLEFGDGFIRFYKNGAMVTVDTVSNWSVGATYAVGDLANYQGVNYYCILAHAPSHIPPNATYWYALSGYEFSIPSPYTTALLSDRGAFCFSQNNSEMKITHSTLLPRKLVRVSDTSWTLTAWNVDASSPTRYGIPTINKPTSLAIGATGTGTQVTWEVTAVTEAGEESLPSGSADGDSTASGTNTLTWNAPSFVTGYTGIIKGYNVYRRDLAGGDFYLKGFTTATGFSDSSTAATAADTAIPPKTRPELNTTSGLTGGFPKRCGTYQQRTLLGNFPFNTQAAYASMTGIPQGFTRRFPYLDDDSILFQVRGAIRHFLDLGTLIVLADTGEWIVEGNTNGAITPTACFPKQFSYYGASANLVPLIIGAEAIYVQANDSIIRSLGFDSIGGGKDGLRDQDLTAFAEHLFEGHTIRSWGYQKTPHSIVWAVREDGVLLSCTYIKDQQILAWTEHETDGLFEEVCCIQEGTEYGVYVIVARTINGATVRFMERLRTRVISDIVDAVFLDSSLTFDGRNTGSDTMTLSGSGWTHDDTLTLTSTRVIFSAAEIGNEIWLTGSDGVVYRCAITAFTSNTVVSVIPDKTIAVASGLRTAGTTSWARAVDEVSGLDHLEAKEVSVFADGYVVANPNNAKYGTALTVTSGAITLPQCHSVIHVGLPYLSDMETLNIETSQGESLIDKKKLIHKVMMHVKDTRGIWVGPKSPSDDDTDPLENLKELKIRQAEAWATPVDLVTDVVEVPIRAEWNSNGRVFIRQADPEPMEILSVATAGMISFSRGGG